MAEVQCVGSTSSSPGLPSCVSTRLKEASAEPFLFVVPAPHISHLHTPDCDPVGLMVGEGIHGLTIFRDQVWPHCI